MVATDTPLNEEPIEWSEPEEEQSEQELGIGRRMADWKTLASFAFAILVMAFVVKKGGIDPAALWHRLRTLNLGLFLSAFVIYYCTFPLRGFRWKALLHNAYSSDPSVQAMDTRGLTEIIYISWFVNCVVPAKLGDLYRAYLAKLWTNISFTKTIGTVMAERIVDIVVLSILLSAAGFAVFHNRLGQISIILMLGVGLAVVGLLFLIFLKTFSDHIRRLIPPRFHDKYLAFEEGTLHSFRRLPLLLGLTALIWTMEGGRLQLVFAALGLHAHNISGIPFVPMIFLALATAVFTTVPFTPGGLGLVEVGLGSIMIYLGMPKADAAAVVVVDRILSYYSIAVFGFIVYLVSKRSHFRQPL